MNALQFVRSVPRWLLVRGLAAAFPGISTSPLGCLRLADLPPPALPGDDWVQVRPRLSGICGSDLATITCQGRWESLPLPHQAAGIRNTSASTRPAPRASLRSSAGSNPSQRSASSRIDSSSCRA